MTELRVSRRSFLRLGGSVALAVAGTGVLAACTGTGAGSPVSPTAAAPASGSASLAGSQINFWWFKNDPNEKVMDQLAADFKNETGITVAVQESIAFADYYNSLTNAIAAGTAPDAAEFNSALFGQLIASNVLANLNDDVGAWGESKGVIPTLWPTCTNVDGSTKYALPLNLLMFMLLYRKDLLQEAGVQVPKTQDDLVSASKVLAGVRQGQYGFMVRGGYNGQDNWAAFLVAGGARIVDDGGKVVLDSPVAQSANNLYISTFPYAPPGAATTTSGLQLVQALQAGTATMIIDNIGGARALTEPSENVDAAVLPSATGDPSKTEYMGGLNLTGVLSSSKNKAAAFKWISYLAEAKAQLAIAKSSAGYLPVVTSVIEDPQFKNDRFFQTSVAAAKNGTIVWPALAGVTKATQQTWQPLFQGALLGKNSGDAVLKGVSDSLMGQ
jgi:multiple sugar transport system substrate-binding protein